MNSFSGSHNIFLFEPFIWYEISFDLSGRVNVIQEGATVASFESNTKADLYHKLLSPGTEVLEKRVWPATVKTTFAQLAKDLETYCRNSTGEMANRSGTSNRSLRETQ